jgi:Protein kinase domain
MTLMTRPAPARSEGPPSLLDGRYRVLRELGQGSIARVLAARDEVRGIDVAVKVLHANLRRDRIVADRFAREAEIVRRIEHPHVIWIHDVVATEELLFLVMDLHPGGDLADRLARTGPLAPAEVRRLAEQLCGALDAAHRAGVVHRDIKPQNVLVGPDPGALDVRLCDFGLARVADSAGLTTRSTVMGTPEYMAPEVIVDAYADPRSDIYSVGALLFEAATGRLPFRADTPFQLMRRHVEEQAPRPREFAPALPPAIDAAIARALSKEPLDRFATAAELASAIADEAGGAQETPAALARLPKPSRLATGTCPRCGGALFRVAQVCVDCGAASLDVRVRDRGVAVLVTGPGQIGHKLGGLAHVALVKLLDELPPGAARFDRLRKQPPRLPFFLFGGLEEESASGLVERLREVGVEARVERRASLAPREVRKKVTKLWRGYGFASVAMTQGLWRVFLPDGRADPPLFLLRLLLALATGPVIALGLLLVTERRPRAALIPLRLEGDTPTADLSRRLPELGRREDRRLLARLLDRIEVATDLGAGDLARLLGARAALACRGLVALDDARRGLDEDELRRSAAREGEGNAAQAALDRLRDGERQRGALIADILRVLSRLDLICLRLARAEGLEARREIDELAQQASDLKLELEAERDVTALLERHKEEAR